MNELSKQEWDQIIENIKAAAKKSGWTVAEWWLRNLFMVVDERMSPPRAMRFVPTFVQDQIFKGMWYLTNILKARQHGCSTLISLLMGFFCLTNTNYRAGIIDRTDQEARKKLAKIRFAYDHMDDPSHPEAIRMLGAAVKRSITLVPPSNEHTLTFSNGSSIYAATSLRGGTINFLWITEFGKIAADDPKRAGEIISGSLESVHPGNICVIESTHEGGRFGENYRMIRQAQRAHGELSKMQWKLLFFGWQDNPNYALPLAPRQELGVSTRLQDYFTKLERTIGHKLTDAQKNWYIQKESVQPDMARQYPGTVEEALQAVTAGAIYADIISDLRADGRVRDFPLDASKPLWAFWDLGVSDLTSVWLIQFVGYDIHVLNYHAGNGMTPAQHAACMLHWERDYGKPITRHYLPHDANNRGQSGKTYVDLLREAGIVNVSVVPRTPNVWVGINKLRDLLKRFYFHARQCEKEFEKDDNTMLPSGLGSLEGYRKKVEAEGGQEVVKPIHDEASHGADALRTFAEACSRGMLEGTSAREIESRAIFGNPGNAPKKALMGVRRSRDKSPFLRSVLR